MRRLEAACPRLLCLLSQIYCSPAPHHIRYVLIGFIIYNSSRHWTKCLFDVRLCCRHIVITSSHLLLIPFLSYYSLYNVWWLLSNCIISCSMCTLVIESARRLYYTRKELLLNIFTVRILHLPGIDVTLLHSGTLLIL